LTNQSAEKRTNQATGNASSSLLSATARARCVFVHVAVSVRLPSPRALRHNAYIYRAGLASGDRCCVPSLMTRPYVLMKCASVEAVGCERAMAWSFWCPELLLASPTYSIPIRAKKKFRFSLPNRFFFDSAI